MMLLMGKPKIKPHEAEGWEKGCLKTSHWLCVFTEDICDLEAHGYIWTQLNLGDCGKLESSLPNMSMPKSPEPVNITLCDHRDFACVNKLRTLT